MKRTNVTKGKKGFQPTLNPQQEPPKASNLPTTPALPHEAEQPSSSKINDMHKETLLKKGKITVSTRKAFKRTNYSGFHLQNPAETMDSLAQQGVYPLYERVIFEHITYAFPDKNSAPEPKEVIIVGHVSDGEGVQALVVSVDGSTVRKADGGTYHITYSLGEGRRPVESNKVIANSQVIMLTTPIEIKVVPF